MSDLALHVLGAPRIKVGGEPVEMERRKAIALLVYLAVTAQAHRREALATMLWPEFDPERARNGLRRTLSVLNKTLPPDVLVAARETVGLTREVDFWLDVEAFRRRLAEGSQHDHPGYDLCPDCARALTEAIDLYRGDFLAGFALRDSPAFDEWQFFQADGLRRDQARALERLAHYLGEHGAFGPALEYARRWLALDPLHEPAHRQLMQLYAWSDQRAAALRQYEECKRVLRQELHVAPQPETTALYDAVKRKASLRQAYLQVIRGPGAAAGRRFYLRHKMIIGYARASDIFLSDDFVSSQHARVDHSGGRFLLSDLGSTNGTKVNDSRLPRNSAVRLVRGDVIEIGDTQLAFDYAEPDAEPEPESRRTLTKSDGD